MIDLIVNERKIMTEKQEVLQTDEKQLPPKKEDVLVLKTREELSIEMFNCQEKAGMLNVYRCPQCKETLVVVYFDNGTTPNELSCGKCGSLAVSEIFKVRQPDAVWYRPKDLEELKRVVDLHFRKNKRDFKFKKINRTMLLKQFIEHYNAGGLFCKKLVL
jgi:transcription elongation factor Elf1